MGFEIFEKGSAPIPRVPSVTIQKRGLFSINEAAQELLGNSEAVQFLWDPEKRLIALRGVDLTEPNAYPLRRQSTVAGREGKGPVMATGAMFTKFIELDTSVAKRWTPRSEDGLLIIDLNTPGQTVIANRNRGKHDQEDQSDD